MSDNEQVGKQEGQAGCLALVEAKEREWALTQRLASAMVQSGVFADTKTLAQALVKIKLGEALGMTPAESMASIYFVGGRPCIAAEARAARMKRAGYSWKIERLDQEACVLTIAHSGRVLGTVSYTVEDAKRAGLLGKDNWRKHPEEMLFARAITRAQRRYAPEVIGAGLPTKEEVIDADWIEVEAEDAEPAAEKIKAQLEAAKAAQDADVPPFDLVPEQDK